MSLTVAQLIEQLQQLPDQHAVVLFCVAGAEHRIVRVAPEPPRAVRAELEG